MMPDPGSVGQVVIEPRQPLRRLRHLDDLQRESVSAQRAAEDVERRAELGGDIVDDAVVGGGGAAEHRELSGQPWR